VLHHIIFITACAQNVLQHERKAWTLTRLANSRFNNARPRAAHSPLTCAILVHRRTILKRIRLVSNM